MYKYYSILISFFLSFLTIQVTSAQVIVDTSSLTLQEAEKIFLDNNLLLLAQKYNVSAQRALIYQAKLLPNPSFSISHGLYSGTLNQFFPVGSNDETAAQLSQLVLLGHKRNKQIKIAEANVELTEYQFFDLLRTLKYTLRNDFFNVYYLQQSVKVYEKEINSLQQVVIAFTQLNGKGYIAEKEVVRIKAQLYSLQTEYSALVNQINDVQSEMKLLLQVKSNKYINPSIDSVTITALDPGKYSLSILLDSAYKNRTDLLIAKSNNNINQLNYKYQKAFAIPDLTLSVGYDEQGSFLNNFYSIGAAIDLPMFNRNQGNIKSAKMLIGNGQATQKSIEATVDENVTRALEKAFEQNKMYRNIDTKFSADFENLIQQVLTNYEKRNISLLDFLDFYDSYKENVLEVNTVKFNRVSAFEDLNYYTGTNFFN
ncbi:MAG TPA: TolC family protein [Ferruginibacter sp.]|jgi:cobalt-zinc-cadmium efflux system outer membrane protein|nr:TolC family protein [Ferruginibacter sp.]